MLFMTIPGRQKVEFISACAKLLPSFSGMVYALDRKDNTLGIISLAKSLYSNATSCTTVLPAFFSTV